MRDSGIEGRHLCLFIVVLFIFVLRFDTAGRRGTASHVHSICTHYDTSTDKPPKREKTLQLQQETGSKVDAC